MTLDRILERLLHDRAYREAFARGERTALGISAEDARELETVDLVELERAAGLVRRHVLERTHRGSGSLRDLFPRTFAAFGDDDELIASFLASPAYEKYRSLPFGEPALSLEEAFLSFAESGGIGDAVVRKAEATVALLRALAVTPRPTFRIPSFVHRAPKGWYAILAEGPTLVAALDGNLVTGPVPHDVADALLSSKVQALDDATRAELQALGLFG